MMFIVIVLEKIDYITMGSHYIAMLRKKCKLLIAENVDEFFSHKLSLKIRSCRNVNFVITSGTIDCHNDNLRCHQLRQNWHCDNNSWFSVVDIESDSEDVVVVEPTTVPGRYRYLRSRSWTPFGRPGLSPAPAAASRALTPGYFLKPDSYNRSLSRGSSGSGYFQDYLDVDPRESPLCINVPVLDLSVWVVASMANATCFTHVGTIFTRLYLQTVSGVPWKTIA